MILYINIIPNIIPNMIDTDVVRAVRTRDAVSLKTLLTNGSDPNTVGFMTDEGTVWPLLIYACTYGYDDIVKLLLSFGADPNIADSGLYSAIESAISYGHTNIVEMLLDAGADPNTKTRDGSSILSDLISTRRSDDEKLDEIRQLLISRGANIYVAFQQFSVSDCQTKHGIGRLDLLANAFVDQRDMLVDVITHQQKQLNDMHRRIKELEGDHHKLDEQVTSLIFEIDKHNEKNCHLEDPEHISKHMVPSYDN